LEVVGETHGEATDNEASVVEEQSVHLERDDTKNKPGNSVCDADYPNDGASLL